MTETDLRSVYRRYIDCLNRQDWDELGQLVDDGVTHNGRPFGLAGYRAMLEQDFRDIPDLRFTVELLACEPPNVAARLWFDCRPTGQFLGVPVDGRRVAFAENVFYAFRQGKIVSVWSIVDKAAIQAQLAG